MRALKAQKQCDMKMLHEILPESIYWRVIVRRQTVKFGANFENIINFSEF